jgi:hypothetical protein
MEVEFIGALDNNLVESAEHYVKQFRLNGLVPEYVTGLKHLPVLKKLQ